MKNNVKRWIAVGLAILVFVGSFFVRGNKSKEEKIDMAYFKNLGRQNLTEEVKSGTNASEKIRIINLEGVIKSDDNNKFVISELKNAYEDDNTKGVILKVSSPGGSVYVSEKIAKEIEKLKEKGTPVYSLMGEMAASGGYYVSAPTDRIYASNETLTGSIGVIMQMYSLEGLFDKYGINEQNITSGKMKDAGSTGKDLTSEEKEYFQGLVDSAFDRFVKVVAEGRDMSEGEVRKIADGRVYDGSQALENGLVDKIGDEEMAIADMTEENDLSDPMVIESQNITNSFMSLFSMAKDFKTSQSDLAIVKEFMEKNTMKPMYIYGGSYGR